MKIINYLFFLVFINIYSENKFDILKKIVQFFKEKQITLNIKYIHFNNVIYEGIVKISDDNNNIYLKNKQYEIEINNNILEKKYLIVLDDKNKDINYFHKDCSEKGFCEGEFLRNLNLQKLNNYENKSNNNIRKFYLKIVNYAKN